MPDSSDFDDARRALDEVPAPDLWAEAERRAADGAVVPLADGAPAPPPGPLAGRRRRRPRWWRAPSPCSRPATTSGDVDTGPASGDGSVGGRARSLGPVRGRPVASSRRDGTPTARPSPPTDPAEQPPTVPLAILGDDHLPAPTEVGHDRRRAVEAVDLDAARPVSSATTPPDQPVHRTATSRATFSVTVAGRHREGNRSAVDIADRSRSR